jgi:hypothetical protein
VSFGVTLLVAVLAACGSSRPDTAAVGTSSNTAAPTTPATVAQAGMPATTVAHLLPTAPNCGGGAYKPATLLIVCASGDAAVMATGVTWRSWGTTAALGSGTVHVVVHGQPAARPATLSLGGVTNGPVGPQFTQLTVTWIGPSPTGALRDSYHLPAGA